MGESTTKELKAIEDRLDDAWDLFQIALEGRFQVGSEPWSLFLAAIRNIRHFEGELIELVIASQGSLAQYLAMQEAEAQASFEMDRLYREAAERRYAERQRVKSIPCPHCGVAAGKPCVTRSGQRYRDGTLHLKRRAAYNDAHPH